MREESANKSTKGFMVLALLILIAIIASIMKPDQKSASITNTVTLHTPCATGLRAIEDWREGMEVNAFTSADSPRLAFRLPYCSAVSVEELGEVDGWVKIKYQGQIGFVGPATYHFMKTGQRLK